MARRSGSGSAGAGGGGGSRGSSSGRSSGGSSSGGGSRGGSSGGSSSGGGGGSRGSGSASSSSSRGSARTSAGSAHQGGRTSSVTSNQSTGGTPARKVSTVATTKRQTRTPTTLSATFVRASNAQTRATGRPAPRTVVRPTVTVSPPANRLTGGRIAQNPTTPKQTFSVPKAINAGFTTATQRTTALLSGGGTPVTVTFAGGQKQSMALSPEAIKYYQNQGLKVSPVQQTFGGSNPAQTLYDYTGASVSGIATPQIPRIVNPSIAYDQNPPAQLHVSPNQVVTPKTSTRTNSAFGGLGANPWNPIDSIMGLFDMSPQPPLADPASQWLPQQENNTQSQGYPTYTAMAEGQYQDQAFANSPQGFSATMLDPTQTIKNLFQNKYILYAGLAIGALLTIKIVMGMFGGRGGSSGGTKIYT